MPKPRADFECRSCEKTYADLPTESIACPVCRKKRGFRRLFNAVRVTRGGMRKADKFINKQMIPHWDQHLAIKASSKRFAAGMAEVKDRMWEKAGEMGETGQKAREVIAASPVAKGPRSMAATAAFAAIDPAARAESRYNNWPALEIRQQAGVHPVWVK